jgi:outer membrane protein OmpA-like peptidoglycan-associated protein
VRSGRYYVAPPDDLRKGAEGLKAGSYKSCFDQACQIELGKAVAAAKLLSGRVFRIGTSCRLVLDLYDLRTERSEASGQSKEACTPEGLERALDLATSELLGERTPPPAPPSSPSRAPPSEGQVMLSDTALRLRSAIQFNVGRAKILPESYPILDEVAAVLNASPSLRVEIGCHTDNIGQAALNQRLTAERDTAVAEYLTTRGVAASRLVAVGYGMTRPLAPNLTQVGRAQNRRCDFTVLSR